MEILGYRSSKSCMVSTGQLSDMGEVVHVVKLRPSYGKRPDTVETKEKSENGNLWTGNARELQKMDLKNTKAVRWKKTGFRKETSK